VDKRLWPQPRGFELFQEWFEVEWHYMVYEASDLANTASPTEELP